MVNDYLNTIVMLFYHIFGTMNYSLLWISASRISQAAQMLVATAQLAYPNYVAEVWHVYLVYVAMMFFSYAVICLPTRYVSWFNIGATGLGIIVLVVTTIVLPVQAPQLNSAKAIFTEVRTA